MLSPAWPSSKILRNISTPVHTVLVVGRNPTISTSSPVWTIPCSTLPVTTVPRPVIVNTSSIGIKNGLSKSRSGSGTYEVDRVHQLHDLGLPLRITLKSLQALTRTTGRSSPGNPYDVSSSRTSSSTSSNSSSSSTASALFNATTMYGTPT